MIEEKDYAELPSYTPEEEKEFLVKHIANAIVTGVGMCECHGFRLELNERWILTVSPGNTVVWSEYPPQ